MKRLILAASLLTVSSSLHADERLTISEEPLHQSKVVHTCQSGDCGVECISGSGLNRHSVKVGNAQTMTFFNTEGENTLLRVKRHNDNDLVMYIPESGVECTTTGSIESKTFSGNI